MDTEGRVWRHMRFVGGGALVPVMLDAAERAERSSSQPGGYLRIMFLDGRGVRRTIAAHRVAWMVANRRTIPALMEINHINGNKQDNRPANLELVTHTENTVHRIRVLGKKPKARLGTENSSAKIDEAAVVMIRRLAASGEMSQAEIGRMYGVKQSTISAIVLRKSWAHVE